jgi:phosphonoacetaldehyde hydrolase
MTKYRYKGPIKCVILDWSGTLVDPGVLAPAIAFVEVFKKFGIEITMKEARIPMGLRKDLHISAILDFPNVRNRYFELYGKYPTKETVNMFFEAYIPIQMQCLSTYGNIIEGTNTTLQKLKSDGIKFGLTTGFTKDMSDLLLEEVRKQGIILDSAVAGDEVENGIRPSPSMLYKNLDHLGIDRIQSVIKVDDTTSGIGEAINAGCWSVGVCRWSNYTNYNSLEQIGATSANEINKRSKIARLTLEKSGAHYVIEDINQLPEVIKDINKKLSDGIQPTDL